MLFLDFDGVLNPDVPNNRWDDWTEHTIDVNKGGGLALRFFVNISTSLASALWDATHGNISWLSSWNQDNLANRELAPRLGWSALPTLPYAGTYPADGRWWKLLSLDNYGALPKKWAWADDDLRDFPDALQWGYERGGLLIAPDPEFGLTPDQIDKLAEWFS